jgi:secondary thiamine-phosphate synthase enzyme
MDVITKYLTFNSHGELDTLDITDEVQAKVEETELEDGIVTIFVPGSTGALTTIEYESGLLKDFPDMLKRISPKKINYEHDVRWHDGNGHSHVRSSLIGPSITVPFVSRKLTLGTWQQIMFIEFDVRSRSRKIVIQIMGK